MSAKLLGQVLEADMGSHVRKWVLAKLCDAAEPDGSAIYPGKAAIAKVANCSERTAQRELALMEKARLILVVEPARGHRPTEYRLDLGVFERVLTQGFLQVLDEALDGEERAEAETDETAREDAEMSPRETEEPAARGDTLSPLNGGERGDKSAGEGRQIPLSGETSARASLSDPYDPSTGPVEREARARAPDRKPEDDLDFQALLAKVVRVNGPQTVGRSFPVWLKLGAAERIAARDGWEAALALWRDAGRKHAYGLETYLRDAMWEQVPKMPAGGEAPMTMLALRSGEWFAHFFARFAAGDLKTCGFMLTMARQNAGRCVALADVPSAATIGAMPRVARDGPEWAAWRRHLRERGLSVDDSCVPLWVWAPSEWPPGWVHGPPEDGATMGDEHWAGEEDEQVE